MGREVVTTWLRHGDSGSCPTNFFTSFSGNRIGILFVIFIRFLFVCSISRKFKMAHKQK